MPLKHVRVIKTCLDETYNKVRTDEYFSAARLIWYGLKQGDPLSPLFFNLL
jgi:hypothetical protein